MPEGKYLKNLIPLSMHPGSPSHSRSRFYIQVHLRGFCGQWGGVWKRPLLCRRWLIQCQSRGMYEGVRSQAWKRALEEPCQRHQWAAGSSPR